MERSIGTLIVSVKTSAPPNKIAEIRRFAEFELKNKLKDVVLDELQDRYFVEDYEFTVEVDDELR